MRNGAVRGSRWCSVAVTHPDSAPWSCRPYTTIDDANPPRCNRMPRRYSAWSSSSFQIHTNVWRSTARSSSLIASPSMRPATDSSRYATATICSRSSASNQRCSASSSGRPAYSRRHRASRSSTSASITASSSLTAAPRDGGERNVVSPPPPSPPVRNRVTVRDRPVLAKWWSAALVGGAGGSRSRATCSGATCRRAGREPRLEIWSRSNATCSRRRAWPVDANGPTRTVRRAAACRDRSTAPPRGGPCGARVSRGGRGPRPAPRRS